MEMPEPAAYAPGIGFLIVVLVMAAWETPVAPPAAPSKPECSRQMAGRFWPEGANSNPAMARQLSRRGDLEVCTRTTWSYRWASPTIDINQLRKPR
jgi:hypothetical protein